jgi:hypothetical protein
MGGGLTDGTNEPLVLASGINTDKVHNFPIMSTSLLTNKIFNLNSFDIGLDICHLKNIN